MTAIPKKPLIIKSKGLLVDTSTSTAPTSAPTPTPTPSQSSSVPSDIETKYVKLQHLEHVLLKPEMYVGSIKVVEDHMFVYDDELHQMVKKKIRFVPALYKLFDEGLVNMRDHCIRMNQIIAKQAQIIAGQLPPDPKIDPNRHYRPVKKINISIDITHNQITMCNDGDGIDVAWHAIEHKYVPELIFGNLLTGTNFDSSEHKIVGGQNGYGAKLINVLSTEFIIETVDAHRKLKYTQRFTQNMSKIEPPVIVTYHGLPYTQITFHPDLPRFGMSCLSDNDTVQLMKKRCYDLAACTPKEVTVVYNQQKIEIKTFERYVDLYIGTRNLCKRVYMTVNSDWEVAVCVSPDNMFEHVSFVNGICTYRGGKHVDHAATIVSNRLIKYVSENKKGMSGITAKSIKDNMWLFINTTMVNPRFDTQTKDYFIDNVSEFRSKCDLSEEFIVKLAQSKIGLLDRAVRLSEFKAGKCLKKTDGKKIKRIKNPKAIDAIYAGDKRESAHCILILTEGDSAKTMASAGLSALSEEERKHFGLMPLRGKIINPKDTKIEIIEKNAEFLELKQILGLQQGVDYSLSINSLRYGRIIFMTDADVDGDHIKGLGFNLFHQFWPSLLKIDGFFCSLLTPIVKARHKSSNQVIEFYSLGEYQQWKEANEVHMSSWVIKYYKGLATHDSAEAKEIFKTMKLQKYTWNDLTRMVQRREIIQPKLEQLISIHEISDSNQSPGDALVDPCTPVDADADADADESASQNNDHVDENIQAVIKYYQIPNRHPCDLAMELAFNKKKQYADLRKGWIAAYLRLKAMNQIDLDLHKIVNMCYYDFLNEKLIEYSIDDCQRSIPSLVDGLKPGQRKIVYAILQRKSKKDIKVNEFAGIVSNITSYHHGEQSLNDTIIGLAQDFTGSNNINLLLPKGQFGSRIGNEKGIGKDSGAPRYIHTNINPLTRLLFNSIDDQLYDYLDDDGSIIEPKWYVPTLPMVLINGARGIGTGWSTEVPLFNPHDVIRNIELYLQGQTMIKMQPWYRGFRGTVIKLNDQTFKITGVYQRTGPTTVEITEIPVGHPKLSCSFIEYKNFIESLIYDESETDLKIKSKQFLHDAEVLIGDKTIKCLLTFQSQEQLDQLMANLDTFEKTLLLSHEIKTTNMHLFNAQGVMTKYESPEDILVEYIEIRLIYYQKRKDYLIKAWEADLLKINEKIRFISYINDLQHELKLQNKSKLEVIRLLETYQFTKFAPHDNQSKIQHHDDDTDTDQSVVNNGSKELKLGYQYLLKMPINSLTMDQLRKLQDERDQIQCKLDQLRQTTSQQLWSSDLQQIKQQLTQFDNQWNQIYAEIYQTPQGIIRLPNHLKIKIMAKKPQPQLQMQLQPLVI